MGFFLPVPPTAGGATEKSWHRLALEFRRRGHGVTLISRRWRDWPCDEVRDGVRHVRIPGFDHTPSLSRNLLRDARWSLRVRRQLPPADVTITNTVTLPILPGWNRLTAGRHLVMTGRIPKGQYRFYRNVDRVLAVSSEVLERIRAENPRVAERAIVTGYPIDWQELSGGERPARSHVTVGFVGRVHREKGLHLLAKAAQELSAAADLPPWRLLICGPTDVPRGGSGPEYLQELQAMLGAARPAIPVDFKAPVFEASALAQTYREIDVFCYPSIATNGETFGVAVAEAMAAGAVPVVSSLPCFGDYLEPGINGEVFDHTAPDAASQLARAISRLLRDATGRARMAASARAAVKRFDAAVVAERLLADFSRLNGAAGKG